VTMPLVTVRTPPTEEELALHRRRRMTPSGNRPADFERALSAIAEEKPIAVARLEGSRAQAADLMKLGSLEAIRAARAKIESAMIELDRVSTYEKDALAGLARAKAVEAEELRDLAAQVAGARATVAAFRKQIDTELPKHATAIARIVELEAAAEAALTVLREAAARLGHAAPEPLTRTPQGGRWRTSVMIPGFVAPPPPMSRGEADAYA
jgi:predicted  nucleic acid-binding Zn-ribbon protein